ncbi:MAG: farnesyl diphosphate synthase [Chlamydiota bacterium]
MELDQTLIAMRSAVDRTLEDLLTASDALPYASLFSAAQYTALSPGKRLRPILTCIVATGYGAPIEHALAPACALEMIHAYSLIHDDLPCMDNDVLRRGRPTLHKVYPEWHALLAGDFLLTYAFEVLATAPHLSSDQKLSLVATLAKHAGAHGMIGGQMVDLLSVGKSIDYATLEIMHLYKTASLIVAAVISGATIAKAPAADLPHLQTAAESIGFAFQLIDDVLDIEGSELEIGKPLGSDAQKHKPTAVTLLGIQKSKEVAEELLQKAYLSLKSLSQPLPLLTELFDQMIRRKR